MSAKRTKTATSNGNGEQQTETNSVSDQNVKPRRTRRPKAQTTRPKIVALCGEASTTFSNQAHKEIANGNLVLLVRGTTEMQQAAIEQSDELVVLSQDGKVDVTVFDLIAHAIKVKKAHRYENGAPAGLFNAVTGTSEDEFGQSDDTNRLS